MFLNPTIEKTQNTHLTYYQRNKEKALAEANEYYENN